MGRRIDIKPLPSLERLQELLSYDEQTGVLTWKMQPVKSRSDVGFNLTKVRWEDCRYDRH